AKALRKDRNEAGSKLFERDEVLRILDALDGKPVAVEGEDKPVTLAANPALKAMVMLGVNCGFGNTDVASLPRKVVSLETGWVNFPRPKTEIARRIPLWPETIVALKEAMAKRSAPVERAHDNLCFLTRNGRPWVRVKLKENDAAELNESSEQEA